MVYMLLANGFEEIEALEPLDILRRAGIDVKTVGVTGKTVTGAHKITVTADITFDAVDPSGMGMLILPGGAGYELLDADNRVHSLLNYAVVHNLYISAICAAPSILGKKGLLNGKKATCFPDYENFMYGAELLTDKVVTDGNYITARGAGAASEFAFEIVKRLRDAETAEKLKGLMQY